MPDIGQQHSIEKSRQLQRNLYLAAKKDKQRRFHALYDRIFRLDILWRAWKEVRENKGSAGIDGVTFEMIEEYEVEEYLLDIQEDLQNKKYRPKPAKRVYIPKPDGKQRPLGIPAIRDRIVQQACKIVIEPIFEGRCYQHTDTIVHRLKDYKFVPTFQSSCHVSAFEIRLSQLLICFPQLLQYSSSHRIENRLRMKASSSTAIKMNITVLK